MATLRGACPRAGRKAHPEEHIALFNTILGGAATIVRVDYEHFRDDRNVDRGIPSFLGVPAATELAGALRARGIPLPEDVLTIDDAVEAMWTSSSSPAA